MGQHVEWPLVGELIREKILLKKLAARVLPRKFDRHRKQGFSIPLTSRLHGGPWREFFRDVLSDSDGILFCKKILLNSLDGQDKSRK
jgi:asparagine synthase (glutamine-hydrolysing)